MSQELTSLKKELETYLNTKQNLVDNLELIDILSNEELESLKEEFPKLEKKLEELELSCLLSEEEQSLAIGQVCLQECTKDFLKP